MRILLNRLNYVSTGPYTHSRHTDFIVNQDRINRCFSSSGNERGSGAQAEQAGQGWFREVPWRQGKGIGEPAREDYSLPVDAPPQVLQSVVLRQKEVGWPTSAEI
jgi:hypothetical protein